MISTFRFNFFKSKLINVYATILLANSCYSTNAVAAPVETVAMPDNAYASIKKPFDKSAPIQQSKGATQALKRAHNNDPTKAPINIKKSKKNIFIKKKQGGNRIEASPSRDISDGEAIYSRLRQGNMKKATLQDLLKVAYVRSPKFRSNIETYKSEMYRQVGSIHSSFLPSVSIDGFAQNQYRGAGRTFDDINLNADKRSDTLANIRLTQSIFNFGQDTNRAKAAYANIMALQSTFFNEEQKIISGITEAYLDALAAKEEFKINEEFMQHNKILFEAQQHKRAVGYTTITEYETAKANYQISIASANQAQVKYQNALLKLHSMVDAGDPEALHFQKIELVWPVLPKNLAINLEALRSKTINRNHDLNAAGHTAKASNLAAQAAAAQLLPSISLRLEGSYGDSNIPEASRYNKSFTGGVSLNWSVYNPNVVANLRSRKSDAARDRYRLADAARQIMFSFNSLSQEVNSNIIQCDARETAYNSANLASRAAKEQYNLGQLSITEYINIKSREYEAQLTFVGTKSRLVKSWYQLLFVAGDLTASNLNLSKSAFRPYSELKRGIIKLILPGSI